MKEKMKNKEGYELPSVEEQLEGTFKDLKEGHYYIH